MEISALLHLKRIMKETISNFGISSGVSAFPAVNGLRHFLSGSASKQPRPEGA
jgi:hypothetical protein